MCEQQIDACLSVLDLLDLDEIIVDERIDKLIKKTDLSIRQLNILITLIGYKRKISIEEDTSCDSEYIINFALQNLLPVLDIYDVKFKPFLKILTLSIELNQDQLQTNVDHILQQLLSALTLDQKVLTEDDISKNIVLLTIINDLAIMSYRNRIKLNLKFMKSQINILLQCKERKINVYLFSNTIPNLIKSSEDYDILNSIYDRVVVKNNMSQGDILILCTLSDFYFPSFSGDLKTNFRSSITRNIEFWKFVHLGFTHDDEVVNKCSSYLAKRAIDYILSNEVLINVYDDGDDIPLFYYNKKEKTGFKNIWSNFFIIMEAIQEKQFHLVKPALELLRSIEILHPTWSYCLLRCALQHENNLVLIKTLNIVLKIKNPARYSSLFPYKELLVALNKLFIYDELFDTSRNTLMSLFHDFISSYDNFCNIIGNINRETFSPIPRFFICYMLMNHVNNKYIEKDHLAILKAFLFDGVSYVTNNAFIETGTQVCLLNFYIKNMENHISMDFLVQLILKFDQCSLYRNNKQWNDIVGLLEKQSNVQEFNQTALDMMYNCNSPHKMPVQKLSKLLILMVDASILDVKTYIAFINSKLDVLKDSGKRTYAAVDEFDDIFVLITETLNVIHCEHLIRRKYRLYDDLIELIKKKSHIISNFFIHNLHILSSEQIERVNLYSKSLEVFLCFEFVGLDFFQNIMDTLYNYRSNENIHYFAVKIQSKLGLFLFKDTYYKRSEKLNFFQHWFETFPNISLVNLIDFQEISKSKGSIASSLLDSICELNFYYLTILDWTNVNVITVNENVLALLEKGGCLLSTIKVSSTLLPYLVKNKSWQDEEFLLKRIWQEIMQIRKNEQFRKCIDGFIKMLFNKQIFHDLKIQEICLNYGKKIIELGELNPYAMYLLVHHINGNLKNCSLKPLSSLLTDIALYGSVLRKDQRIELEVQEYIEANMILSCNPESMEYVVNPTNKIKLKLLDILIAQKNDVHLNLITELKNNINVLCKSKHHYHTNSLNHRILFRALQNLIFLYKLTCFKIDPVLNITWAIQMLCKHPHHASVKIIYEWIIALHLLHMDLPLVEAVDRLNLIQLPHVSYFTILYHVVKRQVLISQKQNSHHDQKDSLYPWKNLDFVMNTLLPYTMGQSFNLRLHAQYLTNKLYTIVDDLENKNRFVFINEIIGKNLLMYADEKNLKNMQNDFYVNDFDIIDNLNVEVIFYHIPRLTGVSKDEWIIMDDIKLLDKLFVTSNDCNNFLCAMSQTKELLTSTTDWELTNDEILQGSVSIQRKFIPWKNMLFDFGIMPERIMEKENQLIVVASLIDRLPNLGGLSRTCEVLGVKKYVINSLKHLQNKQFQNLSVSSENWVDIMEVQPGKDLKNYLMEMKHSGYKIIGVEQTTGSVPLNEFKFPKNTLLLLGHEKDGIPADLLYIADQCVEVPQEGLVRSLNVHVTASIFIWEYSMQHTFEVSR